MSRHPAIATSLIVAAALLAGCAPGLAANPRFATNAVGAQPRGHAAKPPPPGGPPPIAAPKNDLPWHDCTSKEFGDAAVPPAPGVKLDCATYDADLDPVNGSAGTLSIGVVRAKSVQTPHDAGPLVFTTGSDLPSSLQLPVWLSRAGADVLNKHPIVAVDRRGIGSSSPIDCLDQFDRQEMHDQAQFESGNDPVANLADIMQNATTSCTDTIAPGDSAYDDAHAATDIERLRSIWDVPALALMGIGNGAQVAMSYASSHSDRVARLVLDSPVALGVGAEAAAEEQVKGQQAALDAFAAQCAAVNCPLGPDPKAAVSSLLDDARARRGVGGASVATLAAAITTALGFPTGDRVSSTNDLATALATARSGDTNLLTSLINRAEATTATDGQFVNSCSDALNRPTPDRVRELVVAWAKLYPQFGTVAALNLVKCVAWPTASPPQPPKVLKVNVLLMGVQNDPIVGEEGVSATAATIINASAASKRVMWQGIGHGASIYSSCAVPPLIGYLDSGQLPPTDTYCPA
jgi:pimeloyl-ACP methyl ester carboxylesterase